MTRCTEPEEHSFRTGTAAPQTERICSIGCGRTGVSPRSRKSCIAQTHCRVRWRRQSCAHQPGRDWDRFHCVEAPDQTGRIPRTYLWETTTVLCCRIPVPDPTAHKLQPTPLPAASTLPAVASFILPQRELVARERPILTTAHCTPSDQLARHLRKTIMPGPKSSNNLDQHFVTHLLTRGKH